LRQWPGGRAEGTGTAIVSHANFLPFTMALCETRVKMPWQQFDFFFRFGFGLCVSAFFDWRLTLQLLRKKTSHVPLYPPMSHTPAPLIAHSTKFMGAAADI